MLRHIALFEIRTLLRRPLFYLAAFVFFLLAFGAIASEDVIIGGVGASVNHNAPIVIIKLLILLGIFGIFPITAFVAGAALRDFEFGTHELIFATPVRKRDLVIGRFAGALLASLAVLLAAALGTMLGSLMPWLDPAQMGPFTLNPYLWALAVVVIPNVIFLGAVFFALAGITGNQLVTYLAVVGVLVLYSLSRTFLDDLGSETIGTLLDPFGAAAIATSTKYWTIAEQNTALPAIDELLIGNRLLWTAIGLLIFAASGWAFRTSPRRRGKARGHRTMREQKRPPRPTRPRPSSPSRTFSASTALLQWLHQTGLEVKSVFKSTPFLVILAFGAANVIAAASYMDRLFGTPVYPATHLMLRAIEGSYSFLLVIIVTFYAGELVWRERSLKMHEVFDAAPVPDWVPYAAKITGLTLVSLVFLAASAGVTMLFQLFQGYSHLEPSVYAKGLLFIAVPFVLVGVLAVFLHVVTRTKFLGYLVMLLFLVSTLVMGMLDLEHGLYRFAGLGRSLMYSDMNGFGHYVTPFAWFSLYWTFFCVLLAVATIALWRRGSERPLAERLRLALTRFGPISRWTSAIAVAGFLASGSYIFYNTNVRNEYVSSDQELARRAAYERKYRQYARVPQPRITAVEVDVDIYPEERRIAARGTYTLRNKADQSIAALHVTIAPEVDFALKFDGRSPDPHQRQLADRIHGYHIYDLPAPLAPGDTMDLTFDVTVENPGFVNHGADTSLVANGTFFNNREYFPILGYVQGRELVDRGERRKRGLPPSARMAAADDAAALDNNLLAPDADWIDFRATVSTSPNQIALAPGYLQKEWIEGDRRYFRYEMDAPILHFYAFLSAAYEVRRDRWKDVAIEVYHHPGHDKNVARMIEATKDSLDYFTQHFGLYQFRQIRIIEFPGYRQFAQSFPNTIPFSESIGFIADLRDQDDIDYVYYVTAHEVAHQWWGHQVISGNVQGASMLTESLSQYSALMVMEKQYGRDQMRRFLKYELDRYLRERGGEIVEEMPLLLVENQPYIHYRKGSVVLYALRDYMGEKALNETLAAFIADTGFAEPPWTNSLVLYERLQAAAPPALHSMLDDMLQRIVLFHNRIVTAEYRPAGDGTYAVTLTVEARKVHADGQGMETEIDIGDPIDIGVFGADGEVLYLDKHFIDRARMDIEVTVPAKPLEAGIDPYNKLIDRNSDDNRMEVTRASDRLGRQSARHSPTAMSATAERQ